MDSTQFNHLVIPLSDKFYRLAKSILRNGDLAQDAVQDLIVKLWEKRGNLDEVENLHGFTMRAMHNLCLDKIRQSKDEIELLPEIEFVELNPYQQTEQKDLVLRIKAMIENLPELQRTIIRMRDVEGFELSEIAYITSLTENAVSVNLSRARQRIRERILVENRKVEEKQWK
jgi:RNA polymerase sigma-70 factor (ECF subfamily)